MIKIRVQLLAQTLIEIKAAKPKAVTTAATTTTTVVIRPKARGVVVQDPKIAQRLQAELQAELEEEERLARQKVEDDNLISWDNTQPMMEADYELAQRLQAQEHQLKNNSFDEVQKAFDKTMGWIDSFVSIDSEVVKGGKEKDEGSVTRAEESSSKRAGT
ncbi:hypothetical protein Tco_0722636 [Tanacetum coccineum]